MKLNTSLLLGILFILAYLDSYSLTALYAGLAIIFIISGLFEVKNYHNKKAYLSLVAVITAITSILTYIQLSSPSYHGDKLFNSIFAILVLSGIIWMSYDFTKKWKTFKKESKGFNYFLIAFIILGVVIEIIKYL